MRTTRFVMCAVAFGATLCAGGTAAAQTVVVRGAPAGSTIELQLNTAAPASTQASQTGEGSMSAALPTGTDQIDVRFFVDLCGTMVRLQVMTPGVQPAAPAPGCNRNEVSGVFVMRRVTTFVVDIDASVVSVHLTQGPPPPSWLGQTTEHARKYFLTAPPRGLVVFVGASLATIGSTMDDACGSASPCSSSGFKTAGAAGAALWITRFFGAQATFARPADMTATGSGDTFRFGSTFDSRVFTIAGMGGVPAGPVRIYGLGGGTWHRASFITNETINDQTITVDNVSQTIPGGTATFDHHTEGWSWLAGGGLEAWMTRWVAIYGEAQYARLKASEGGTTEGGIDDHLLFAIVGARVRIGR